MTTCDSEVGGEILSSGMEPGRTWVWEISASGTWSPAEHGCEKFQLQAWNPAEYGCEKFQLQAWNPAEYGCENFQLQAHGARRNMGVRNFSFRHMEPGRTWVWEISASGTWSPAEHEGEKFQLQAWNPGRTQTRTYLMLFVIKLSCGFLFESFGKMTMSVKTRKKLETASRRLSGRKQPMTPPFTEREIQTKHLHPVSVFRWASSGAQQIVPLNKSLKTLPITFPLFYSSCIAVEA